MTISKKYDKLSVNILRLSYDTYLKLQLWPFGGEKKFRQTMIEEIEFSSNDKILDMCCGFGGITFAIRERLGKKAEIIGLDLLPRRIIEAKKKNQFSNVKFIKADARTTGFRSGYFDKVFIPHALHEMIRETRLKVLREANRILREGAKLIVIEEEEPKNFKTRFLLGFWFGNLFPYSILHEGPTRRDMIKHGIINEIKEAGFKHIQKISKFKGLMQVIIAEK